MTYRNIHKIPTIQHDYGHVSSMSKATSGYADEFGGERQLPTV